MSSFQAPTGVRDVLAPESARWEAVIATFARLARLYSYGLVVGPMFEDAAVFRRGVGSESEVVAKQMYEFEDKGGRQLALRPEGTASIVRAFLQHRPNVPWKAWYVTPAFRYERPQAGRYRQHHQLGVEVLGSDDPDLDVEVISYLFSFLRDVGLRRTELRVNSMGDGTCNPPYRAELGRYLLARRDELCDEHRLTAEKNPLRVLDCKKPECIAVRADAPRLSDALCEACRAHFERVLEGLDVLGIPWSKDEYLVRGFDYYTRTTFEFASTWLDAAQNAVGGGGRYDGLAGLLGGPDTPGIGFASGIERVVLALVAEGVEAPSSGPEVFVVDLVGGSAARVVCAELRNSGIATDQGFDHRSLKAQLRLADRSGARVAVIVGAEEEAERLVTVRELRGSEHGQMRVARDRLLATLAQVLS